ncbi:hypothetical protein T07_12779 [Trichinella nelsoni]|uniref:Uncharacterized protein n=1 Tax=Trichinella nelsoni TaxID=6336 RepID=A0A0V0SI96_9BILA|nr:hypothetical protein T07_12779 [Trichinella nelsoni]
MYFNVLNCNDSSFFSISKSVQKNDNNVKLYYLMASVICFRIGTILNVIEFVFNYETPKNGATLLIQINTTLLAKDAWYNKMN